MYNIGKHINGISVNPLEYLMNGDKVKEFATKDEAKQFLLDLGVRQEDLDAVFLLLSIP